MKRLGFYLHYSLRALRRDGTRTFLAGLSVAFGVLSLVAMQSLAHTLLNGALFDQRLMYGGDGQIFMEQVRQPFAESDLEQIAAWQQEGLIDAYTPISNSSALFLRTQENGRVYFLHEALGIEPATYPLTGEMVLRDPAGATTAEVLRNSGDALITRDIADALGLRIGSTFLLGGDGAPVSLTVSGVVEATPSQAGDSVFYNLETARLVENRQHVINAISVNWGDAPNAVQTLIDSPYRVFVASERADAVEASSSLGLFELMLQGAGVLGLLIGGIGVSNTLQVILARRKLEIAMLKTLGFRRGDLLALISLETGLIGLIGGMAGALIGAWAAGQLVEVLGGSGAMMIRWSPDPLVVGGGVAAGVVTAVVFGMQAILVSSATRPVELMRDMPRPTSWQTRAVRLALYGLMLVVFGALIGVILGSILKGIAYVFVGGLLLVLLRGVFWVVLWAMLRLPLPPLHMLRLARANLRRRKTQSSLAVMALFAGAFSVTFAVLVIYKAQSVVSEVRGSDAGYNLMVYTTIEGESDASARMVLQGALETFAVHVVNGTLDGVPVTIEGRAQTALNTDITFSGEWNDAEAVALLPQNYDEQYDEGDSLTLQVEGQEQVVTLAGFYTTNAESSIVWGTSAVIVPRQIAQQLGGAQIQVRVFARFPVETLNEATTQIGAALPNALVFSRADVNDRLAETFRSLFTFAASISGLAFVAGAVLIANSAGLTVVERRREIGVFKAVGYTSSHVLRLLLSEYGFLGVLGGVFGIIGVFVTFTVINSAEPAMELVMEPTITAGMLLLSVSIAVLSAAVVAWQPTRVRPLDVLRYE